MALPSLFVAHGAPLLAIVHTVFRAIRKGNTKAKSSCIFQRTGNQVLKK